MGSHPCQAQASPQVTPPPSQPHPPHPTPPHPGTPCKLRLCHRHFCRALARCLEGCYARFVSITLGSLWETRGVCLGGKYVHLLARIRSNVGLHNCSGQSSALPAQAATSTSASVGVKTLVLRQQSTPIFGPATAKQFHILSTCSHHLDS